MPVRSAARHLAVLLHGEVAVAAAETRATAAPHDDDGTRNGVMQQRDATRRGERQSRVGPGCASAMVPRTRVQRSAHSCCLPTYAGPLLGSDLGPATQPPPDITRHELVRAPREPPAPLASAHARGDGHAQHAVMHDYGPHVGLLYHPKPAPTRHAEGVGHHVARTGDGGYAAASLELRGRTANGAALRFDAHESADPGHNVHDGRAIMHGFHAAHGRFADHHRRTIQGANGHTPAPGRAPRYDQQSRR